MIAIALSDVEEVKVEAVKQGGEVGGLPAVKAIFPFFYRSQNNRNHSDSTNPTLETSEPRYEATR